MTRRDKLFREYSKLPKQVQVHTDKVVRAGYDAAKRTRAYRDEARTRSKAWVEKKIAGVPFVGKKKGRRRT